MRIANLNEARTSELAIGHIKGQSGRISLRGLGVALRSPEIDHLPDL